MESRRSWRGYLFVLPAFVIIMIFRLYPILQAMRMSLYQWGIAGPLQFIGLKNFAKIFVDPKFYQSLGNTFWYVIFVVPLTILLSLFFASLLNLNIRFRSLYRTVYYLPVVTSIVAISVVWKWIFNADRGLLNAVLGSVGVSPVHWLNDARGLFEVIGEMMNVQVAGFFAGPSIALLALIIMSVWHNLGYCIIIALAGLQNVPEQYYEAARIDGASNWRIFLFITLPVLSPTIFYLLVTQTIIAFNTFTPVYVMTQPTGGPIGTTSLVVYYLYEQSFRLWNLGYANALACVIFLVIFLLTQVQKRFLEQRVFYE